MVGILLSGVGCNILAERMCLHHHHHQGRRRFADVVCTRLLDLFGRDPGSARQDRHEERPRHESDGNEDGQRTHGPDGDQTLEKNMCEELLY